MNRFLKLISESSESLKSEFEEIEVRIVFISHFFGKISKLVIQTLTSKQILFCMVSFALSKNFSSKTEFSNTILLKRFSLNYHLFVSTKNSLILRVNFSLIS